MLHLSTSLLSIFSPINHLISRHLRFQYCLRSSVSALLKEACDVVAPLIWMIKGQKSLSPWSAGWVTVFRHASNDQRICDFHLITAFDAYFHQLLSSHRQLKTVAQPPQATWFQADCCSSLGSSSGGDTSDSISADPTVHRLRCPGLPLYHLLGKCVN